MAGKYTYIASLLVYCGFWAWHFFLPAGTVSSLGTPNSTTLMLYAVMMVINLAMGPGLMTLMREKPPAIPATDPTSLAQAAKVRARRNHLFYMGALATLFLTVFLLNFGSLRDRIPNFDMVQTVCMVILAGGASIWMYRFVVLARPEQTN